jgi:hypothetical protein
MKITGFDDREYNLNLARAKSNSDNMNKSQYHLRARILIKEIFSYYPVYEEVSLPGSRTHNTGILFADFFLPRQPILIEVHGEQHYKYNQFYHGSKQGFLKHRRRDRLKAEWCDINNVQMIVLPYNLEETWESLLTQ